MLRTRTTRWTVGTAALCLLLLVATWLLLVSPRRSQAADLTDQTVAGQRSNQQLQTRIEELKAQYANLGGYRQELVALLRQLPPTAAMPQLVRDLNTLATATGVTMESVTPSSGRSLAVDGASGAGSGSAASGSAASGSAGSRSSAPAGVVEIPVAIVVHGDYFQAVAFLQKLQTALGRALLISGVQVAQSSEGSGVVQLSISGAVYAWPAGAEAMTAPGATAPGATAPAATDPGATAPATTSPTPAASPSPSASASASAGGRAGTGAGSSTTSALAGASTGSPGRAADSGSTVTSGGRP
jgi:Tfp pilus assembly protein PilO